MSQTFPPYILCSFQKYFCFCPQLFLELLLNPILIWISFSLLYRKEPSGLVLRMLSPNMSLAPSFCIHLAVGKVKPPHFHLIFSEYLLAILVFSISQVQQFLSVCFLLQSTDVDTMCSLYVLTVYQHLLIFWGCWNNFSLSYVVNVVQEF